MTLDYREQLLRLYDLFPFHKHPLWRAIIEHRLSRDEVLAAEAQHYIRSREGRKLRFNAMQNAQANSPALFEAILDTYLEECTDTNLKESKAMIC